MMLKTSAIAQSVFDAYMNAPASGDMSRLKARRLRLMDGVLKRSGKHYVNYQLGKSQLIIPFSHALPYYRKQYAKYSQNIVDVSASVVKKYPQSSIIDIGANIGDTVALIRSEVDAPILCVEGEAEYFEVLAENAKQWSNVILEKTFVAIGDMKEKWVNNQVGGTAHLTKVEDDSTLTQVVAFQSLNEILSRHPQIRQSCRLVKVDTDGFDLGILNESLPELKRELPVLFFEYDPHYFLKLYDGLAILKRLMEAGYPYFVVYDNWGNYLLSGNSEQTALIEDVHHYYTQPNTYYCDMVLLSEHDCDIAKELRVVSRRHDAL